MIRALLLAAVLIPTQPGEPPQPPPIPVLPLEAVYSLPVDTTAIPNGAHTFCVKAWDAAGNYAVACVPVVVDNHGPLKRTPMQREP